MSDFLMWKRQELLLITWFLVIVSIGWWNYTYAGEYAICVGPPLKEETKNNMLPLVGAAVALLFSYLIKTFFEMTSFTIDGLKHPIATRMAIIINIIQTMSLIGNYTDILGSSCEYFWGMRTSPFLWLDWMVTVPFLFFLTAGLDVKKTEMTKTDIYIQLFGGGTIVLLFTEMITYVPSYIHWITFTIGNVVMTIVLILQQLESNTDLSNAKTALSLIPVQEWDDINHYDIIDSVRVSEWKWNVVTSMSIMYTVIPLVFYVQYWNLLSEEIFIPLLYSLGFVAKTLMCTLVLEAHSDILDVKKVSYSHEKRRREQMRSMFLRYVFHEVRVPLNSLSLGLQLLNDSRHLDDQELETVTMMVDAAGFMNETLNDVLSLQKIEEGKLELEECMFAPHTIVASMLNNLRSQFQSKRITITAEVKAGTPIELYGDRFRLEHVLGNLLSNAIKFSDEHSRIEITVQKGGKTEYIDHDDYVVFSVRDYGVGIAEADKCNLFQPFMQIRPGELQKGRGSGLGLSICKTIMNLHKGIIGCNSTQRVRNDISSGGSEFYFGIKATLRNKGLFTGGLQSSSNEVDLKRIGSLSPSDVDSINGDDGDGGEVEDGVLTSFKVSRVSVNQSYKVIFDKHLRIPTKASPMKNNGTVSSASSFPQNENLNVLRTLLSINSTDNSLHGSDRGELSVAKSGSNISLNSAHQVSKSTELKQNKKGSDELTSNSGNPKESSKRLFSESLKASHAIKPPSNNSTDKGDNLDESSPTKNDKMVVASPQVRRIVKNILICDDVMSNRKMLEMVLKRKGLVCDKVEHGQQAVDKVRERGVDHYHLIFMDSVMPVMCGPDASRMLRSIGFANTLVGLTGNAMDVDIEFFEEAGVDAVLIKPLNIDRLDKVLGYCGEYGVKSRLGEEDTEIVTLKAWMKQ